MNNDVPLQSVTLPYEKFAHAGLTPELVDSLPENVKQEIAAGKLSQMITISLKYPNGVSVSMPVKFHLSTDKEGHQRLMAYPLNREFRNDLNYNSKAFKKLNKGFVIAENDRFIQKDPETNCLIIRDKKELALEEKLREFEKVNDIELGQNQKEQFLQGKPVELNVGGEKVVVGLDLRSPESFRELNGNMKDWEQQKAIEYDIAHPEYVGLVQTEENRWEYQKVVERGVNNPELRNRPAQSQSASMRR